MIDCIFIHTPKIVGSYIEILKMPIGLVALSDLLDRNGISSKIIHLTIEKLLDPDFDLGKYLKVNRVKIAAISLHWHPQSYQVIATARQIKKADPDIKIMLGGFTATLFAKEILTSYPEIDFVIKGDAEKPLLLLSRSILNHRPADDLKSIPNLVWRSGNEVVENEHSYVIDQNTFDELDYSNLDLINNQKIYSRIYDHEIMLEKTPVSKIVGSRSFCYYNIGRGCPVNCSFCGGANLSQCLINKRKEIVAKSTDSAVRDLVKIKEHSIDHVYTSFDPYPGTDYYLPLFSGLKEKSLGLNMHFECWSLPSKSFIDSFSSTFGNDSRIIISPDTGSEKVRELNKGFLYTNQELIDNLNYIYNKKIRGQLYYSLGFPFENKEDIAKTVELMAMIKKKYGGFFEQRIMPIELDPGSPMWLDNEKYGITVTRSNFNDIYLAHRGVPTLGYHTNNFREEDIIRIYREILKKV